MARRLIIIAAPDGERALAMQAVAGEAGWRETQVLSWPDFATSPERLAGLLRPGDMLRLDAPDGDLAAWRALAAAGAAEQGVPDISDLTEPGLVWRAGTEALPRLAWTGLTALAHRAASLAGAAGAVMTTDPRSVAVCGDKAACHAAMSAAGIAVPRALTVEAPHLEALLAAMAAAGLTRVFVKPRHGSSAAGIVALARGPGGLVAYAPAEIAAGPAVYSIGQVRRFTDHGEIAALVGAALRCGAHVEHWVPKAGLDGAVTDLRLLVIAGRPRHLVLRAARGPITNLHLGARRADPQVLLAQLPPGVWDRALDQALRFAAGFPQALHLAFDIAVTVDLRRHVMLEANVFGDLLRRVSHDGHTPQQAELAALDGWLATRRAAA